MTDPGDFDPQEDLERQPPSESEDGALEDDDGVPDGDGRHRRVVRMEHRKVQSGPIPAPEALFEYGQVDPSFPERLVAAFERQSEHRQDMERKLLEGSERRAGRGQLIGSGLVALGLTGGIIAILMGEAVVGASIIVPSLAGGVLTYLFGFGPRDK